MRRIAGLTLLLAIVVGSMLAVGARSAGIRVLHRNVGGIPVSIYTAGERPSGAVVLVHDAGLNRPLLRYWGLALASQGFDVYIPDLPGHGANRTRFGDDVAVQTLRDLVASFTHEHVALAGQGYGAAAAYRAAHNTPRVKAVVLLSPPTLHGPAPPNLFALAAERDADSVREAITDLAGGPQNLGLIQGDLREGSGRQGAILSGTGRARMLLDAGVVRAVAGWVHAAFGTRAPGAPADRYTTPVPSPGLEWMALGLLAATGVVLATISALSPRAEYAAAGRGAMRAPRLNMLTGLLLLALSALAAVIMGAWLRPFAWLHLAGGDYVVSYFLFMAGILFSLRMLWPDDYDFFGGPWADLGAIGFVRGLAVAGVALVAFGPVLHTNLSWFLPVGSRLLPFLVLAVGMWFYFVQEEALKRAVATELSYLAALIVALLGKAMVIASWVGAAYLPNPPADFLVGLLLPLGAVLLLLECFGLALDRSGYPISTGAVLKAVLFAWVLAVTLPVV